MILWTCLISDETCHSNVDIRFILYSISIHGISNFTFANIKTSMQLYRKWGKFRWAKLLWYPEYMDFRSNTLAVQDHGTWL